MESLQSHRTFFAHLVATAAGAAKNERLIEAFASTPREKYLGRGPWTVFAGGTSLETPSADPAYLYQDVVVALAPERHINNGQPVLHAMCLAALDVQPGERILHIGAGTGYYTAILAKLTGPTGSVEAYEIEADLAARAAENFAEGDPWVGGRVAIHHRNAAEGPLPEGDVIYVNAGATTPMDTWLDALRPGGRLLFPLTPADGPNGTPGAGAMLLITRPTCVAGAADFAVPMVGAVATAAGPHTKSAQVFTARFLSPAVFIPCIGARDEATAARLSEGFRRGDARNVRSLRRHTPADGTAWCSGKTWWLSTAPAEG